MRDDVTVIVTTFAGREDFSRRAIACARDQARVLVVDDGARPADHAYASWWEGVYRAQTPYVAILHDDDWYEPTFVERAESWLAEDVAWVATEGTIHFPDGTTRRNLGLQSDHAIRAGDAVDFLSHTVITPSCVLMRRKDALQSLIPGGLPGTSYRSVVCGPDLLYTLLAIRGRRCRFIGEPLVNLTAHAGSATIAAMSDPAKTEAMNANYAAARRFAKAVMSCS